MAKSYQEYMFKVEPLQPGVEILIAELAEIGFDSFQETVSGVLAYIPTPDHQKEQVETLWILNSSDFKIDFSVQEINQQNWNAQWEKDFKPIEVTNQCRIRAPFHEERDIEFDIVIHPKMAFGTGHHQTTFLMMQFILKEDLQDKSVLDMGCGTGVLGILASLKGTASVDAVDIDVWSYENTLENAELNNCKNISVFESDVNQIKGKSYDFIFANINRNILLKDLPEYEKCLNTNGSLFLSGFYKQDLPLIKDKFQELKMTFVEYQKKGDWVAVKAIKA